MTDAMPDIPCPHATPAASLNVTVLTNDTDDIVGYTTEIKVWCNDCETPFLWNGLDVGLNPQHPTVDVSGEQMNAPLRPKDAPEDFGTALPGFRVAVHQGLDPHQTELNLASAITNPSIMTPRKWEESAERWAARAVMKMLEIQ